MVAASPPEAAGVSAPLLLALRHALADPLSAAALKLDLMERRLTAPSGADPSWVAERVRAAQADVAAANRLLDLLLRLAEIAGERPRETSLGDVCGAAGVSFHDASIPRLTLRPRASAEAIRNVASFATRGTTPEALALLMAQSRSESLSSPVARAVLESGRVTLAVEGSRLTADGRPERLLDLPHGIEEAQSLFLARAAVEADGGRLELSERGGRFVALFSWPLRPEGNAERKGGAG